MDLELTDEQRTALERTALERVAAKFRALGHILTTPIFKPITDAEREKWKLLAKEIRQGIDQEKIEWTAIATDGTPYPEEPEDWARLAVRAGINPDTIMDRHWTYAELWPLIVGYFDRLRDATPAPAMDDDAYLPPSRLAEIFEVPPEALRARLNRWRKNNPTGWIENDDRGAREPQFTYRVGSIRHIIEKLKTTSI